MIIGLKIHTLPLLERLRNTDRRIVYGTQEAINATAKDVQQAEFREAREHFTIRNEPLFFGTPTRPGGVAARISPFANVRQGRMYAEVAISDRRPGRGRKSPTFFGLFEEGGTRPTTMGQRVAAPVLGSPARPTKSADVPTSLHISKLNLRQPRLKGPGSRKRREALRAQGKRPMRVGLHGTFEHPHVGILQRAAGRVRLLFGYIRPPHLDGRLSFVATAQRVARVRFPEHLERQALDAVARDAARRAA